ncbi:MAG: hypothetical protein ACI8RZ_005517, partial [Myxococcota bacterium]
MQWRVSVLVLLACVQPEVAMSDPPPPDGVVLPKPHERFPVREAPQSRGSTWTIFDADPPRQWVVDCSILRVPTLSAVTVSLFRDSAEAVPTQTAAPPFLEIQWREDGQDTTLTRLTQSGDLLSLSADGEATITARLSAAQLQEVRTQLATAAD